MARSKAREFTELTVKRLYALSANRCAFPECPETFVNSDNTTNLSQICHIEAAEPGGQRYNSASNDDYRRSYENLILLCANHHIVTNDISVYETPVLQKMKQDHEDKMRRQTSGSNILSKNPSALNTVIGYIGAKIFENADSSEPTNAPNPEEKIKHNNVIRFKPIIEEYAAYHGKLNKLYEEIEKQGSTKKEFILQNIKNIYLKEKGKYKDINEIRANADAIIDSVQNQLWNVIENANNPITSLPLEAVEISLLIIMVDAFMRCNILEEPPKK